MRRRSVGGLARACCLAALWGAGCEDARGEADASVRDGSTDVSTAAAVDASANRGRDVPPGRENEQVVGGECVVEGSASPIRGNGTCLDTLAEALVAACRDRSRPTPRRCGESTELSFPVNYAYTKCHYDGAGVLVTVVRCSDNTSEFCRYAQCDRPYCHSQCIRAGAPPPDCSMPTAVPHTCVQDAGATDADAP